MQQNNRHPNWKKNTEEGTPTAEEPRRKRGQREPINLMKNQEGTPTDEEPRRGRGQCL